MSEQGFQVDCSGMAHSTPPDPCVVVIFGVAGDLGRTTLVPSLYALACQKLLPEPCAILGVARRDWDDETFRDEMRQWAQDSKDFSDVTWQQFAPCLYFVGGDFDASSPETYAVLRQRLSQLQAARAYRRQCPVSFSGLTVLIRGYCPTTRYRITPPEPAWLAADYS